MATPTSTQLQIASDSGFNNLVVDKSGAYAVNISVSESDFSGGVAPRGTTLYTRVKHSADTGDSAWSSVVNFIVAEPWSSITASPFMKHVYDYQKYLASVKLSDTKVLVCFSNYSNSTHQLYAYLLTISGTTITAATAPFQCNGVNSIAISMVVLSLDNVLVMYLNGNTGYLNALLLTISGNTVTASALTQFDDWLGSGGLSSIDKLTTTKAIACFQGNNASDRKLYAVILSIINGNSIQISPPVLCTTSYINVDNIKILALTDTKAIVVYSTYGGSFGINAQLLTISSNMITPINPNPIESARSRIPYLSIAKISDTKVLLCLNDKNNGYLASRILSITTNNTIWVYDQVICGNVLINSSSVVALSDTKALVISNIDYEAMDITVLTIFDTTVSLSTNVRIWSDELIMGGIPIKLSDDTVFVCLNRGGVSGTLLSISELIISNN